MTAYYNEFDPKAAAWLRELIKEGHIADGVVDERSIVDVNPEELHEYTQCHFFAGIGGWSRALRLASWPDDRPVWTGSCPCQPFSVAGKQMGRSDPRHLFPAWAQLIRKCRPSVVFGEQVANNLGRDWLAGVRLTLEVLGYAVGGADLCSAGVGAPNIRQRLYWVADTQYSKRGTLSFNREDGCDREDSRRQEAYRILGTCSEVRGVADSESRGLGIDGGSSRNARHADKRGAFDGMDDSSDPRGRGRQPLRAGRNHESGGSGQTCGVANPNRDGDSRRGNFAGQTCSLGQGRSAGPRVGEQSAGLENGRRRGKGGESPWSDFRNLMCSDGKTRRIPLEPSFFPLAYGVPGRVGLLRGYGNAINPWVAKAFIEAYEEASVL